MAAARFPHFIAISGTNVVQLQLIKANFTAGLSAELDVDAGGGTTGTVPTGKTLIGRGKQAAMESGCFGVNLVYAKTTSKNQVAKVLCSPNKADTIFKNGIGKNYGTYNITAVRVPRRRIYSF